MRTIIPMTRHFDEVIPAEAGDETVMLSVYEQDADIFDWNKEKVWLGDFPETALAQVFIDALNERDTAQAKRDC